MKQFSIFVAIAWLMAAFQAPGQEDFLGGLAEKIEIEDYTDTTFDPETGIATITGDAKVTIGGTYVEGQTITYNVKTGEIVVEGGATVIKDGQTYNGKRIVYNSETGDISGHEVKTTVARPLLVDTDDVGMSSANPDDPITLHNATITTHDRKDPNYRIVAKKMIIYPDDRVVFKNVKIYAGKTPVLWLPYFSQPLDDELGYTFAPGYSSRWGAFLLNQYGVAIGDHTVAKYQLDLRSTRGVAGGVEFNSRRHRDNENFGRLYLYYAYDNDPTDGPNSLQRETLDQSRYRVNLQHRIYLPGPEESTFYLDFDINKLSDQFFYQDFFFREAVTEPRPDNLVNLVKHHERGTLSVLGRFQANDFFRTDVRSPEIALDITRQQILGSNFYIAGEASFGIYQEHLADIEADEFRGEISAAEADLRSRDAAVRMLASSGSGSTAMTTPLGFDPSIDRDVVEARLAYLNSLLEEPEFSRLHSSFVVDYPINIGEGTLLIVPRAGGGVTNYWDVSGKPRITGESEFREFDTPGSDTRVFGHAGLDISTKFSRVYSDVQWPKLGVNEIRHIVQPYVNYSYTTVDGGDNIPSIDRLTPTSRLRPIDLPQFTAVDDIRSWNVVRVGLRNIFQTKRDTSKFDWAGQRDYSYSKGSATHNWAGVNTAIDFFIDDPEYDRSMSNLFNEVFWRPVPWLRIAVDSQVPLDNNPFNFTEVNSSLSWLPNRNYRLTLSNLFLSDNPFFEDSNLVTLGNYLRLGDRWAVSTTHRYEIDDSTLEYQGYSLHYDLTSWTASVGGLIRNNRSNEDDYGFVFQMTLKAFPSVRIPLDFGTLLSGE